MPDANPPASSNDHPASAAAASGADHASAAENQTDVYAIHGADPEVLAYAMAKYSRSSLSMRESLAEISSQRAEQFLNTFYFQYGHRSIADLAHIPFAVERLSLLAAISLVDEQRWDGQERSTRYQNFRKSGWHTPALPPEQRHAYTSAVEALFAAYDKVGAEMLEALQSAIPQPGGMKDEAYLRTLKARAFDVARYLLPLATNTSLGQIVSARTLESQISRLLSSEFAEIRALGEKLRAAAAGAAWNVHAAEAQVLCNEVSSVDDACGCRISGVLLREVKTAPTLVKYAAPNDYAIQSRAELRAAAAELMSGQAIEAAPVVDLVENIVADSASLEIELATSLLYPECHYSWRQLQRTVATLPAARVAEICALGAKHRGRHDELLRAFSAGHALRFDILMDIGGFRDMHRHRRCIQLIQPFTDAHGYEEPVCPGQPTLAQAGLAETYKSAMDAALTAYRALAGPAASAWNSRHSEPDPERAKRVEGAGSESPYFGFPDAAYLLPLGTRVRAMFKMDFAEALYISELRSAVAGHFSYRRVAWEMYQAVAKKHPALAPFFRIEDVNEPVDLLKR